jgi:hypothetical protein
VLAVCVNLMAKNNWLGLLQFLIWRSKYEKYFSLQAVIWLL